MGKSKTTGKNRLDKFYHLAKEQGYRSRAAFKLIQLDAKYTFLHTSRAVLDLCAAPGGWMQVAVQRVPVGSLVVGLDLFPINPIRGALSYQEDITKPKCRATLKKVLQENGFKAFDLIVHDGSPNVGGAWAQEATSQNSLVIDSVRLATEFLSPKGCFVTKVFRSQDYSAVLFCLKQLFEKVEVTKPVASRSTSAEIYVVAKRYKAPAKVDPRLLDIKHLFQGAAEPSKVIDVLSSSKQKRHRSGYDDDTVLVRKVCPAADFVWSDTPLEVLGTVTSISFDDPGSLTLKDHTLTTNEIIALCEDLRVLGKQDFKQLLKWRLNVRKALASVEKITSTSVGTDKEIADGEEKEEDDDEKLLHEMEELTQEAERKKKRQKKRLAKKQAKDKGRKMQIDALEDGYVDNDLFSLASVKGKNDLAALDTTEDSELAKVADSDDDAYERDDESESSDMDSDEERKRYDDQVDEILDEVYERFVAKMDGSTAQRKRAKRAYAEAESLEDDGDGDDADIQPDYDSDKDQEMEANPLLVAIDKERDQTQDEITNQWFLDDVFAEAVEEGALEKDDSDDDMKVDVHEKKHAIPTKPGKTLKQGTMDKQVLKNKPSMADDDLEIVPAPATDSSDSSSDDDSSGYDTDTKAETLAYAKRMLRKKARNEIIDDAYNKYMFDDDVRALPKWFVDEEKKHYQPMKPITKEEVNAIKAANKEINARPAKKVAEAKARKKRATMRKMEKIRKKANTIADQTDIADRSKKRLIDSLYKKAEPRKPKREFVVAKKGVQVRAKGKTLVDRRMKKDARHHGMNKEKKQKGKRAGKGKGKGKGKGSAQAKGQSGMKGKGKRN